MLVYLPETFIKAHENVSIPYKNHSYDRYVRFCICGSCGSQVGEQVKYPNFEKEFSFADKEKGDWIFCPICGNKLKT